METYTRMVVGDSMILGLLKKEELPVGVRLTLDLMKTLKQLEPEEINMETIYREIPSITGILI